MPSDNAQKSFFETYRNKYSLERNNLGFRFLKKTGWLLYQPYKYLFLIPFLIVTTIIFSIGALVFALTVNPKVGSICGTLWSRFNSFVTPMIVNVTGSENIDKNQSYVIVANHLSFYDIYVLYGWIGIDFKWVMKHELRKVPFLGISCEILEHVYVDRSNREKALESINRAKERIKNGTSIIFFPEGSRSYDGNLKPFKKGAFKMALDLNLPVLPVTINGTQKILEKGTINLLPGKAGMVIHEPIDISDYDESTIEKLMDEAKARIASKLEL